MAIVVGTELVAGANGTTQMRPIAFHTMHMMAATEGIKENQGVPSLTTVHLNGDCAKGPARRATLATSFTEFQQHLAATDPRAVVTVTSGQRHQFPVVLNPHFISNVRANYIAPVGTDIGLQLQPTPSVTAEDDHLCHQRLWTSAASKNVQVHVAEARKHKHNDVIADLGQPVAAAADLPSLMKTPVPVRAPRAKAYQP